MTRIRWLFRRRNPGIWPAVPVWSSPTSFDAKDYPLCVSPIGWSHAGEDACLWVEVVQEDQESPMSHWDVLDPEGEVRGGVELPRTGLRILRLHGDDVWASVADDLDVPWLVRYRLVPGELSPQH